MEGELDAAGLVDTTIDDLFFEGRDDLKDLHIKPGVVCSAGGKVRVLVEKSRGARGKTSVIRAGMELGRVSSIVEVDVVDTVEVKDAEEQLNQVDLSHLTGEQAQELRAVFREYPEVASTGELDIGCAGVTRHKIELYDDTPIRQQPRRFPKPVIDEVERQCEELLAMDVIEYSKSPYSSPIVPIRKKDGSLRLCIDYRKINEKTVPDRQPMPVMQECLFQCKYAFLQK